MKKVSGGFIEATIIAAIIDILGIILVFYKIMPAMTCHSAALPGMIASLAIIDLFCYFAAAFDTEGFPEKVGMAICLIVFAVTIIYMLIGAVSSGTAFNAKKYSSVLSIENGDKKDIPASTDMHKLFLTDTKSAKRLCERVLGSNADYTSQYDVGRMTQIVYKGESVKVAPLKYNSFWKWNSNKKNGIPAYIIVKNDSEGKPYAKLIELDKGMKYVPSAAFNQRLKRHIYRSYRSYIFEESHFEINESGNPYYVTPYEKPSIGLYGGKKIAGAVVTDPVTGKMTDYDLDNIPSWVDLVVDGDTISKQYDWYGELRNGFWNSYFGQKGCVMTTDDFGYVSDGTDIWIFTGVTSVTGDSSNLGFVLANERTGQTKYIQCDGADEASAMSAAEGEVQEKKYSASFPSLIMIDDEPTYIMVLKDKNMLTKDYACVNVQRYDQIAVAADPESCFESYRKLINGEISQEEAVNSEESTLDNNSKADSSRQTDTDKLKAKTIHVKETADIVINGNTYVYIMDDNGQIYRSSRPEDILAIKGIDDEATLTVYTDGTDFMLTRPDAGK